MSIPVRDLTRHWRKGDAERLARFLNETGRGWPGGAWDPQTPEEVEREVKERRSLATFVAEVGDEIVSFCSLHAKPKERNRAYVGLLTAHPDYHGRGFGKAVLLAAVEHVYEMGIPRVDLDTWAGNLKAVPLYKKSGFMWSPESGSWGVYMQNFTPGARQHPIAQPYFRKHDWYRTMKRDLSLTEDEHKRGKVRVYEYLWEEDGDRLRMVYDRQSWGLIEIETNDFLAACFLPDEKLVAGLPQRIRWRIVNHGKEPLDVALIARGDDGIKLDHKEITRVPACRPAGRRGRFEAEAEFEVSPGIKEKEHEPRAAVIHTDLLINGTPIALAAGFEVKQALHFALDADGVGLRPDRAERVVIQAFNELDRPVEAKLRLSATGGARLDESRAKARIPANGSVQAPVTLHTAGSGPVLLRVEAEAAGEKRTVRPKAAELYAHVLLPGELVGHVEEKRVVLESAAHQVVIFRRGGWTRVLDKIRNRWEIANIGGPVVGPPFGWEEFFDSKCDAAVVREEGRIIAVLRTESIVRPGIWLERRIALANLPVIEISDTIINGSEARLSGRLRSGMRCKAWAGYSFAPTANGVVRSRHESFGRSLGEHRLSDEGADWPEGWYASEDRDGVTTGAIWDSATRVEAHGEWMSMERELPPTAPGQSSTPGPVYLYVGDGGHAVVRRWWQQLFGPRVDREQRPPKTRQPLELGLRPRVLVMHGRRREAELVVDSVGRLEFAGTLRVSAPEGVHVRPGRARFSGVCEKKRFRRPVTISRSSAIPEGAYSIEATAQLDRATYRETHPLIALGDARKKVSVARAGEDKGLFRVDNGTLSLTVAPSFNGSAVSLNQGDMELLRSAYPEAHPLAYENPWFGGICPHLGSVGRELFKEKWRARQIERRGEQGVVWKGVRVSCAPKQERGRWEAISLDYLLAPGSAIIALAVRTTRRTGTHGWMEGGFTVWPVLGDSHLEAVLSGSSDPRTSRLRTEHGAHASAQDWMMAVNGKSGHAVLVSACGRDAHVGARILGRDGYCLTGTRDAVHEAKETGESVFFLAFVSPDQAKCLAQALSELDGLP